MLAAVQHAHEGQGPGPAVTEPSGPLSGGCAWPGGCELKALEAGRGRHRSGGLPVEGVLMEPQAAQACLATSAGTPVPSQAGASVPGVKCELST